MPEFIICQICGLGTDEAVVCKKCGRLACTEECATKSGYCHECRPGNKIIQADGSEPPADEENGEL